jgi:DNA primase small subunit
MKAVMEDIVLFYTYPCIDTKVSKHRNHLLKVPFCVHPKTRRVCVLVDPKHINEFNPESLPTVGKLLRELDDLMKVNGEGDATEHHSGLKISLICYLRKVDCVLDWEKFD